MIKTIAAEELYKKMQVQEKLLLVDVRAQNKYNEFHIEGNNVEGVNVPKTDIFALQEGQAIPSLPVHKEMVITCTTGNSATKCANILAERNYNVVVLEGGITAWKEYVSKKSVERMWSKFKAAYPEAPEHYEAWSFGDSKDMADELAQLVLDGTKTATASNYILYELENEPLPQVGLHNIILDGDGKAVAVAETITVEVVPFNEVTERQAYLEGEGDRTLSYWREVHEAFYTRELKEINQDFKGTMLVVCETFRVLYKA